MDFHFSAQEEAFRQEVRAWLAANMPPSHTSDAFEERRTPWITASGVAGHSPRDS